MRPSGDQHARSPRGGTPPTPPENDERPTSQDRGPGRLRTRDDPAGDDGVGRLADEIARAVEGCSGVAALARGTVATYLPGRVVTGVAVRDTEVEVAVVARYGRRMAELAADVRAAVTPLAPGRPIHVRIDDLEAPRRDATAPGAGPGGDVTAGRAGQGNGRTGSRTASGDDTEVPGERARSGGHRTGEGD
jgi:hypothetical protein